MAKAKKKFNKVQRQSSLEDKAIEKTISETMATVKSGTNPNYKLSMAKICRLCELTDGPFLNIFGSDVDLIKKIEQLLPITVQEDDELPHKICFRCSAKVEDLHDFTKKCIQAQQNLSKKIGKSFGSYVKTKRDFRSQWEEKLNKSKLSNDQICNEMVMKAMKGMSDIDEPDLKKMLKEATPPLLQPPRPFTPPTEAKQEETPKPVEKKEDKFSYEDIRDAVIKKAVESIANIDLATLQAKRLEVIQAQNQIEGISNIVPDSKEINGNDKGDKKVTKSSKHVKTHETEEQNVSNNSLISNKEVKVSLEKLNKDKSFSGPTRSTRHSKLPEPVIEEPEKITRNSPNKEKAKTDIQKEVESDKLTNKLETTNETKQTKMRKAEVPKVEKPLKSKKLSRREQKKNEAEEEKRRNEEEKRRNEEEKRRNEEEKRRKEEEKRRNEEEKRRKEEEKRRIEDEIRRNEEEKLRNEEEIMKHVSCIRVGGVGELFTCQLCKRNFLKKEGVLTHVCQKIIPKPIMRPAKEPSPEPLLSPSPPRSPSPPPKKVPHNQVSKKKPGPASKTKSHPLQQLIEESTSATNDSMISLSTSPYGGGSITLPDPQQKRYKLVAGPNNSFMLVEDVESVTNKPVKAKPTKTQKAFERNKAMTFNPTHIIDLDDQDEPNEILPDLDDSYRRPYPVGLISAVQPSTNMDNPKIIEHSYSIKPSNHPNKIVISSKQDSKAPPETAVKKTQGRKRKHIDTSESAQPYSLLMDEASVKQNRSKPTQVMSRSIIQESQISTSSKNRYRCTFCSLTFSREKKLEAHLKEHASKFGESSDEELPVPSRFFSKKKK